MPDLSWRTSSFSDGPTTCVELASAAASVHLRNSNRRSAGALIVAGPAMATWISGIKAGDYDDLAG